MTVLWTSAEAAKATGGRVVGNWAATGVSIDTRSLKPGDLFVPLKDIRDGHDFIPMAIEKGAAAVLTEREVMDIPALIVPDTLEALRDLAVFACKRSAAKRIAVTGSVGKTSVKEVLALMCAVAGPAHKSLKSYNNHWGVPLTLALMPAQTKYGVFEAGMNHEGELSDLSALIAPNLAVITKIAPAHLAHFNSLEDIAKAKAEIVDGLAADGVLILPAEALRFGVFADLNTKVKTLTFGAEEGADARILATRTTENGTRATLSILGQSYTVNIPMPGAHWVENIACALLAAGQAGVDLQTAITALQNFEKLPGRGESQSLNIDGKAITLIDESYNANPESMRAAIAVLGLARGRKIAVLGDMLELGATEDDLHAGLSTPLQAAGVDCVLTCGMRMKALATALPPTMNTGWTADWEACLDAFRNTLKDGDTVMVKGSNASGMGHLVAALKTNEKLQGDLHVV